MSASAAGDFEIGREGHGEIACTHRADEFLRARNQPETPGVQEATFCAWRIAKINLATATSARSSEDSNLAGNHSILPQLVVALLAIIVGDDLGFFAATSLVA